MMLHCRMVLRVLGWAFWIRSMHVIELTCLFTVQTVGGEQASGFTCMEWQDWFLAEALPAAQHFADTHFVRRANDWFDERSYEALCRATGYDTASGHKKFLISHDSDSRHSFKHHGVVRGKKVEVDRRLLPQGSYLAIPIHPTRDYVPLCRRVQDCIQSPVEMVFAHVKVEFRRLIAQLRREGHETSPQVVVETALAAFNAKVDKTRVYNCWSHAFKSLLVWTTPRDRWVTIEGVQYKGTGGNWVPQELAG